MNVRIGIVGARRCGLAFATQAALRGVQVVLHEPDRELANRIAAGDALVAAEPGLAAGLEEARQLGRLEFAPEFRDAVRERDAVVFFIGPRLLDDGGIDDSPLFEGVRRAAPDLAPKTLLLTDAVLAPGQTREFLAPLARAGSNGASRPIFVAHAVTRWSEGRFFMGQERMPVFVGGLDPEAGARAALLLQQVVDTFVLPLPSCEMSELLGLVERAGRAVAQGFAGEVALLAQRLGLDAAQLIALANTQPWFPLLTPALGGQPEDVELATRRLASCGGTRLTPLLATIDERVHEETLARFGEALGGFAGKRVLILRGLGSPDRALPTCASRRLAPRIEAAGARVSVAHVDAIPVQHADALVVADSRVPFFTLAPELLGTCRVVLDCENALSPDRVAARGMRYVGVGR